jgi:hypothetical protein
MITNIIVGFIGLWIFVEALHTYQKIKKTLTVSEETLDCYVYFVV